MQILSLQRKVIRISLGRRARITREMFYFSVISLTGNLPTLYIYTLKTLTSRYRIGFLQMLEKVTVQPLKFVYLWMDIYIEHVQHNDHARLQEDTNNLH